MLAPVGVQGTAVLPACLSVLICQSVPPHCRPGVDSREGGEGDGGLERPGERPGQGADDGGGEEERDRETELAHSPRVRFGLWTGPATTTPATTTSSSTRATVSASTRRTSSSESR